MSAKISWPKAWTSRFGLSSFRLDSDGAENSCMAARPRRVASLPRQGWDSSHTHGLGPACDHSWARKPWRLLVLPQRRYCDLVPGRGQVDHNCKLGAIAAAVEGLGIVMTPLGVCHRELERGALVRLLPEWDAGTVELNAVYAAAELPSHQRESLSTT